MKKIYLLFLVLVGITSSCTKDFADYNTDSKNPTDVKGEFLFSSAQKNFADQISSTSVNLNVFKLFAQQWTETTYVDEANYDIVNRKIPDNNYSTYYRNVLNLLNQAGEKITAADLAPLETEATKKNKLAIIDLMRVFTYHELVNTFGDIPYAESNDIENISPAYEGASAIYTDLLTRIDAAIVNLDETDAVGSFGGSDLIYGGDVAAWKKFAYSLKLKIAVNQSDVVDVAAVYNDLKGKVFDSADDNMLFHYQGSQPNTNPMHVSLVVSGRKDFIPANTLVDLMNATSDPRMDVYFTNMIDTSTVEGTEKLAWVGGLYGHSNAYANYSHIAESIQEATFPGILMTYSEVQFYLAEAASRTGDAAAATYYDAAVTASFDFWKAPDVATYLAANPYVDMNSIAEQSYYASYTRGDVSYTTYRRLDWPIFNIAPEANTTDGLVPRRFTYPINEQTLNKANYDKASAAIGGDAMETLLFWDKAAPVIPAP